MRQVDGAEHESDNPFELDGADLSDFQRFANSLPFSVWIQEIDGRISWVNTAFYDLTRLPADVAMSPQGWAQVIHPDDFESAMLVFQRAISTQSTFESQQRVKAVGTNDLAYRWMLSRTTPRYATDGTLTHWLGTTTDIHDAKMLAQRTSEAFRIMGDVVPMMMWMARADGWIDWYNQRWYEYTGQTHEEAAGWGWQDAHHPDDLVNVMRAWPLSIATGAPFDMEFRLRGADGKFRWFITRAAPHFADDGSVLRWYGTNTDIDRERRERARDTLFARVGEALARVLSLDETLRAVADFIVPEFADWALVNLLDADGKLRLAATHHRDAACDELAQALVGTVYGRTESTIGSAEVVRSSTPRFYRSISQEQIVATIGEAYREPIFAIGVGSAIIVPMLYNGKVVGTISAIHVPGGAAYASDDVPLFERLAERIAPAIGNAASYEREKRIAERFQHAAMTSTLPAVPGLIFDAIYQAGKAEAQVGGDWYDAFTLADGRVVISVGDVAGSGLEAAVTMSAVRQSIRTAAYINPDPRAVLDAADRIVREIDDRFVTAFVGVIDPIHAEIVYATAGHPPALLRRADGTVVVLDYGSLPLGLRERTGRSSSIAALEAETTVLVYTDGLTEVSHDALAGERDVLEALSAMHDPAHAARALYRTIVGTGDPHDDVAILAVTVGHDALESGVQRWRFDTCDASRANAVRMRIAATLRECGLTEHDITYAELVFSELVGNVARYACGEATISLDMRSNTPVLHVLDNGIGFEHNSRLPTDPMQENGRGLFIVSSITADFTISRRANGGSHARAVIARKTPPTTQLVRSL